MLSRRKLPKNLLSQTKSRSPCMIYISTTFWKSFAVEKTSFLQFGIVVLHGMIIVMTQPSVSTPSDKGVTSSNTRSDTEPDSTPDCTAAPNETTSSGLRSVFGDLPKICCTRFINAGIRDDPPTSRILSIDEAVVWESCKEDRTRVCTRAIRSAVIWSKVCQDN